MTVVAVGPSLFRAARTAVMLRNTYHALIEIFHVAPKLGTSWISTGHQALHEQVCFSVLGVAGQKRRKTP